MRAASTKQLQAHCMLTKHVLWANAWQSGRTIAEIAGSVLAPLECWLVRTCCLPAWDQLLSKQAVFGICSRLSHQQWVACTTG